MKNYEIKINSNMTCEIEKYLGSDTEVYIPSEIDGYKVTGIGRFAFDECSNLTNVTIPDGVRSIGESAFAYCKNLTNITIPASVENIDTYAFAGCKNLTNITIPASVRSMGWGVFACCSRLTSINVDKNNPVYHSAGNCMIETESKTLALGCKNSVIPSDGSVTKIGDGAFYVYNKLTNIIIPGAVTSIGDGAFYGCRNLTNMTILGAIANIGESAFEGCDSLTEINFTGTKAQWESIEKGDDWDEDTGFYVVRCIDDE